MRTTRRRRAAALLAAAACAALLAGCAPQSGRTADTPRARYTQVPAATPSQGPLVDPAVPMGGGVNDSVYATVFPVSVFRAAAGCGCTLPGGDGAQELFPKGTYVLLAKVVLRSGSDTARLDAKGLTFTGSKFAGRPDVAVLDTADGPKAAAKAGLPWLPEGAWAGKSAWMLHPLNADASQAVAVAYYIPPAQRGLDLRVNVPGGQGLTVQAAFPPALRTAMAGEGIAGE